MISFNSETNTFVLSGPGYRYIMRVVDGILEHCYFGAPIHDDRLGAYRISGPACFDVSLPREWSQNHIMAEAPVFGRGDYREGMIFCRGPKGETSFDFRYVSNRIVPDYKIEGLPTSRGGETLEIKLKDEKNDVELYLFYTVFDDVSAIARSCKLVNVGGQEIKISRAYSASLDLPGQDYDLISFYGVWARERTPERRRIRHGVNSVDSKRVTSSGALNPFTILCESSATETAGRAWGMNLVYSSSFRVAAEGAMDGSTRYLGGINDFGFSKLLLPGTSFQTPEAVLGFSDEGIGGLSRVFHDYTRNHIVHPKWAKTSRPIVVNNWEATYFAFDYEKLFAIIDKAEGTDIDTFVLDDGWFGVRNNDRSGLGDWFVNTDKLPEGLKPIIDRCHQRGLRFGLWFEPEMISPDSDLYRAHPDWAINCPDTVPLLGRFQMVLDITREEVRDYIVSVVNGILDTNEIDYVKWDYNRNVSELFSLGADRPDYECFAHNYALGLYDLFERIVSAHPNVFFEGCSGGGSRFDLGVLYWFPQIWTSDDSDAIMRTQIQYGTSYGYPLSAMSCHVSACPNHQSGRTSPFETRTAVAHLGATGYELDLSKMPEEERLRIQANNKAYRDDESLILEGDLYRVMNPFDTDSFGELIVAKDKSKAKLTYVRRLSTVNAEAKIVRIPGLDHNRQYFIEEKGITLWGDTLAEIGFPMDERRMRDFESLVFHLRAK